MNIRSLASVGVAVLLMSFVSLNTHADVCSSLGLKQHRNNMARAVSQNWNVVRAEHEDGEFYGPNSYRYFQAAAGAWVTAGGGGQCRLSNILGMLELCEELTAEREAVPGVLAGMREEEERELAQRLRGRSEEQQKKIRADWDSYAEDREEQFQYHKSQMESQIRRTETRLQNRKQEFIANNCSTVIAETIPRVREATRLMMVEMEQKSEEQRLKDLTGISTPEERFGRYTDGPTAGMTPEEVKAYWLEQSLGKEKAKEVMERRH